MRWAGAGARLGTCESVSSAWRDILREWSAWAAAQSEAIVVDRKRVLLGPAAA